MAIPIVGSISTQIPLYPLEGDPPNVTNIQEGAMSPDGLYLYYADICPARRLIRHTLASGALTVVDRFVPFADGASSLMSQDGTSIYFITTVGGSKIYRFEFSGSVWSGPLAVTVTSPGQLIGWLSASVALAADAFTKELCKVDVSTGVGTVLNKTWLWNSGKSVHFDGQYLYAGVCKSGPGTEGVVVRYDIPEGSLVRNILGTFAEVGGISGDTGVPAYKQSFPAAMWGVAVGDGYLYAMERNMQKIRRIKLSDPITQTVYTLPVVASQTPWMKYDSINQRLVLHGGQNLYIVS